MTKETDVADLLGDTKPAKKTAKTKADAAPAKPAKKTAATKEASAAKTAPAKKTKATADAAPAEKAKRVKEKVTFEEGEREALSKRIKQIVKKDISSKELALKLDIPTRKLRAVLYSMSRAGTIAVSLEASRAAGMTVSPAA